MEDQGKRLLVAVAIAFGIMLLWNVLFPTEPPPEKAGDGKTEQSQPTQAGSPPSATPGAPSAGGSPAVGAPSASAQRGPEQTIVFESPAVRAEFSSWGGVLKSWKLLGDQFHEPGHPDRSEDLVRLDDPARRPFAISFSDGSTFTIPADAEWRGEKKSDREVVYAWQSDDLAVEKRYRIHPEDYVLEVDVALEVKRGSGKQGLVVSLYSQQDPKTKTEGGWSQQSREWVSACYVEGELESWSAESTASRVREQRGGVDWVGFLHSFFLFTVAPRAHADNLGCRAYGVSTAPGGMGVDLIFPLATLDAAKSDRLTTGLVAYLGPKYLEKLEAIATTFEVTTGFEKAVDLGFWGFIAGPLLWLLERFYGMVGSWGISIILLTVLVKLATLYWTHKSMKSMKEMAKLRPQLDKLRDKYKDDRQKQQVETMNLFKAHGVNPLAGCLPLLLQMPIWFALYRALSVAAQLYQAQFLWLSDLTAPDPYFILPILMTGAMLFQSRLTPTTGTGAQQKMLMYGMPLMFGVMGFFFPAGLNLYILTNTGLTLLHHLYMRRSSSSPPAAKPAVATEPTVSGRKVVNAPAASVRVDDKSDKSDKSDESDDTEATEDSGAGAVRNGHRPRNAGAKPNRPGRRGGRRKRSSRSS
jgi:YidC/Oxa1 family membrane protein insertase